MQLQRLRQRGVHSLHGGRAGGRRRGTESGQGSLGGLQALDKRALSGADLGHGAGEVGALSLEVLHGPLQDGFTATRRVAVKVSA